MAVVPFLRDLPVVVDRRHPYKLREGVPIPRLPSRGPAKPARVIDDPMFNMMLDMKIGQCFMAPAHRKSQIRTFIQAIRGRSQFAMFITRKITRLRAGRIVEYVGVWRV